MAPPTDPTNPLPSVAVPLDVEGRVPDRLCGQLLGVQRDGLVHSFTFMAGQVSYGAGSTLCSSPVDGLVSFDGLILLTCEDGAVRQLSPQLDGSRVVDVAGHERALVAGPIVDPASGELHLVAREWEESQVHVVIPAGALVRRQTLLVDAPARIEGLAVGREHIVLVADGAIGVASRSNIDHTTWMPTDVAALHPVGTHTRGGTVVLTGMTPALEQWTIRPASQTFERSVIDPSPCGFVHLGDTPGTQPVPTIWTTGQHTISRHDEDGTTSISLGRWEPGDFTIVPDDAYPRTVAGWLVTTLHDASAETTELRVIDAARPDRPALASIRVPGISARALRVAWLPIDPFNTHTTNTGDLPR